MPAAFHDRHEGGKKMVSHTLQKSEAARESAFVEIIEEQTAYPAGFIPVRQEKIAVAPLLVFFVPVRAKWLARGARGAMPVQHVLIERIVRREIEAAAEPPNGRRALGRSHEKPHIAMRGRHIGVSRMKHQR